MFRSCLALTLSVALLLPMHTQAQITGTLGQANDCNYYTPTGTWYYAVNRCSVGGTYAIASGNDIKPVCVNTTTVRVDSYTRDTGCTGAVTSTFYHQGNNNGNVAFNCAGSTCEVGVRFSNTYSFPANDYCNGTGNTTTEPIVWAVPGLCADTLSDTYYCAGTTNNVYFYDSCSAQSSVFFNYLTYLQQNICYATSSISVPQQIMSCTGGPSTPYNAYAATTRATTCNFFRLNGPTGNSYPIDVCISTSLFGFTKAVCKDANTLLVGRWSSFSLVCTGSPDTTTEYTRNATVDFECTQSQCYVEDEIHSDANCPPQQGVVGFRSAGIVGVCDAGTYRYCDASGTNVVTVTYASNDCREGSLNTGSTSNKTLPACSVGDIETRCILGGATPAFQNFVSAGSSLNVMVAAVMAGLALIAV